MKKKVILGYAIGPIGVGLISIVSLPLMTWFFSAEDIGRISMLQIFTTFIILLFSLGLDQAYVREYHETEDKYTLLKSVIFPSASLCIITLGAIVIYDKELISNYLYEIPSFKLSLLTVLCFIFALLSRFLGLIVRMQERSLAFSMSQLLPKLLFLFMIIIVITLTKKNNIDALVFLYTASLFTTFIVFLYNTRFDWIKALNKPLKFINIKTYLIFGMPLILAGLASWGLKLMDRIFLKEFSTYSELGVYSVAMSIAGVTAIFAGVFNTIWSPQVFKWISQGSDCHTEVENALEYLLAAISFFIILSALLSWVITYFLPIQYQAIEYFITICFIGPLFYTLSEVSGIGITITKKTKYSMLSSIIAMASNFALNYLLVPPYGAAGAAISTSISFMIFLICRTEFSKYSWYKYNTSKMYFVATFLLIFSIVIGLDILPFWLRICTCLTLLALNILIFNKTVKIAWVKISKIFPGYFHAN